MFRDQGAAHESLSQADLPGFMGGLPYWVWAERSTTSVRQSQTAVRSASPNSFATLFREHPQKDFQPGSSTPALYPTITIRDLFVVWTLLVEVDKEGSGAFRRAAAAAKTTLTMVPESLVRVEIWLEHPLLEVGPGKPHWLTRFSATTTLRKRRLPRRLSALSISCGISSRRTSAPSTFGGRGSAFTLTPPD